MDQHHHESEIDGFGGSGGEYSGPTFIRLAIYVLLITGKERPLTPLRLWICGYALQCVLHVGFIFAEFQKRSLDGDADDDHLFGDQDSILVSLLCHSSIIKGLESVHTVVSSVWWVFGFYWIVTGGQSLLQDAPRLYWLAVVFLAFDVFFMIFCIAMACAILFSMFCFFPVLASLAYAMKIGERASEDDLRALPKFRYDQPSSGTCLRDGKQKLSLVAQLSNNNATHKLVLHPEDSECCICLHKYVHGAELCALPCNHHFHYNCISKWLRINATCPLCKFNILSGGDTLV
ncbi:hypothetical protein Leryth_016886 [Lithospermum erythrorhizon]|nr:hypothetical protein Leryth_016886 [Lithospermum erythrorhizon]